MSVFKTSLEIDGVEDVPVIVEYTIWPATRGRRDGRFGPKLEPDEPARLEVESVRLVGGREVTLTSDQERAIEEEIAEWLDGSNGR